MRIMRLGDVLLGSSESLIKNYMEIRGVGIINIKDMFGISSVRRKKKIEVVIELQPWRQGLSYERTGLLQSYEEILGIKVLKVAIPVAPGKSLTVISEVIAKNTLLKLSGLDSAKAFNDALLKAIQEKSQGIYHDGLDDMLFGSIYE